MHNREHFKRLVVIMILPTPCLTGSHSEDPSGSISLYAHVVVVAQTLTFPLRCSPLHAFCHLQAALL